MSLQREQFLPTITTIEKSRWRQKIKEINKLKLKKVAVFPTCLSRPERKELYQLLKKSSVREIPFVHLRSDVSPEEIEYLIKNYNTKVFNIHTQVEYPLLYDLSRYSNMIYIENTHLPFQDVELRKFAGICLDFSHLENERLLYPETYRTKLKFLKSYSIGCNHISAICPKPFFAKQSVNGNTLREMHYDSHYLHNLSELDYLKNYPQEYFSPFCALELENSLEEQLKAKDYILKLFSSP